MFNAHYSNLILFRISRTNKNIIQQNLTMKIAQVRGEDKSI